MTGPVHLAEALNAPLVEHNIQVVACPQGRVMGQDNDIRVFDVQHINGLEFDAAFFIAIDRMATLQPKLFDTYLYVGTTRADTYLCVTCEKALPTAIETLRPMFVHDWKDRKPSADWFDIQFDAPSLLTEDSRTFSVEFWSLADSQLALIRIMSDQMILQHYYPSYAKKVGI